MHCVFLGMPTFYTQNGAFVPPQLHVHVIISLRTFNTIRLHLLLKFPWISAQLLEYLPKTRGGGLSTHNRGKNW